MTSRRLSAFVDALAAGRRPKHFRASADDAAIVRTAITLRAAHPGEANPSEQFVADLYEKLADQAKTEVAPDAHQVTLRRGRLALAAVAAAVAVAGGTVAITDAFNHSAAAPSVAQAPSGNAVRTGSFETTDGQLLGQIVAYQGHPSWVFMNVDEPNYDGPIECKLQMDDGSVVAVGMFELHAGLGQFSRTIPVAIDGLRGAKLLSSTGATVASATFS
ncbi:MAG TPA: hypothetical protein VK662_06075 [Acidothermaceae bacterium]|jgi:hypothetical protein|nr:hypothetical protein [Acidothermaceae bacterium]